MIKIEGIDHVGIVSKDPARARWFFSTALQLNRTGKEHMPEQALDTITWLADASRSCAARLELLIPTSPDSTVARFLEQRGGGVHHLSLRVDDIVGAMEELKRKGVVFTKAKPQRGIDNSSIAFIHPRSTGGVLVELVQKNRLPT